MNLLILAANGQIARLVENAILTNPASKRINLTLGLRQFSRLAAIKNRAQIAEVNLENYDEVATVMNRQDLVFVAVVDHSPNNLITKNVIAAMKKHQVKRVVFSNVLGIYQEVPGEFGIWNAKQIGTGLPTAINSDRLLAKSGLTYTTLRLPWLNDRDEIKYTITTRNEPYNGVSVSRKSVADLILKIITNPSLFINESIGIADPETQGKTRPVY